MDIYFATSNKNKFIETKELFTNKITLKHFPFSYNEMRSDSLEEISIDATESAYKKIKKPIFTEDSGLFINSLNGFPGTYSSWVLKKLKNEGILKLLKGEKIRGASFKCSISFKDNQTIKVFTGEIKGKISEKIEGKDGFGYDPIFIPEGCDQTFAQNITLKKQLSHRYNALSALKRYIFEYYKLR
ncbi:MAG: RdgB/HAM1 family non-canonical purine NTP pyrophosphatase [Candidatus Micrarchaeia archaeon]